jgi:four helix bundle protein
MREKGSILRTRLSGFSIAVSKLAKDLPGEFFYKNLGEQMIRSGCSAFLNFGEADGAASTKDFINKLRICLKEVLETSNSLELIYLMDDKYDKSKAKELKTEAQELAAMLYKSIQTASKRL